MSLRDRLNNKSSEELKNIYRENNRLQWRPETFSAIRDILESRGEEVPDQLQPQTPEFDYEDHDSSVKKGGFATIILGILGFLSIAIGIILLINLYSGETALGWFREVSSILLINLGFIGWGFSVLLSVVKESAKKQNEFLIQLINIEREKSLSSQRGE